MGTFSNTIGKFEHTLYRAYDSLGCLLYVGITYDIRTRMRQHKRNSKWYPETVYVETFTYPDRATAYTAELQAINSEHPIYNIRKF